MYCNCSLYLAFSSVKLSETRKLHMDRIPDTINLVWIYISPLPPLTQNYGKKILLFLLNCHELPVFMEGITAQFNRKQKTLISNKKNTTKKPHSPTPLSWSFHKIQLILQTAAYREKNPTFLVKTTQNRLADAVFPVPQGCSDNNCCFILLTEMTYPAPPTPPPPFLRGVGKRY